MSEIKDKTDISVQNKHFEVIDTQTKEDLLNNRKAQTPNRATKQWVSCLNDFLTEHKWTQWI